MIPAFECTDTYTPNPYLYVQVNPEQSKYYHQLKELQHHRRLAKVLLVLISGRIWKRAGIHLFYYFQ